VTDQEKAVEGEVVGRAAVVRLLASYGDRPVADVGERIDSLELAWLLHQVEQRYDLVLDLSDADLGRMSTVEVAVTVLRQAIGAHR
jgi:hypothetical protein